MRDFAVLGLAHQFQSVSFGANLYRLLTGDGLSIISSISWSVSSEQL